MQIRIRTLTPIWTGDVDRKCTKLKETSIIGSLRWWFEAIIRGLKYYACDPTSDRRCPKEKKLGNERYYCPACLIFGATGIRRQFRLAINGGKLVFLGNAVNIKPSGRSRGWYLGSGIIGEIGLNIASLNKNFDDILILTPLILASRWGGIGAKTQHGYGVIKIEDSLEIDFNKFKEAVREITDSEKLSKLGINLRSENNNGLPDIREIFFAKVQFEVEDDWWKKVDGIKQALEPKDKKGNIIRDLQKRNEEIFTSWFKTKSIPIAPAIKNWLRYEEGRKLWETSDKILNTQVENWLFGTTSRVCTVCYGKVKKDRHNPQNFWCPNCNKSLKKEDTFERVASKINISCAYEIDNNLWEFRLWGWIPKAKLPKGFDRDDFLNNLKQALDGTGSIKVPWNKLLGDKTKNHKLKVWREFDSSRDTVKPNENNIDYFLQSLLKGEGE